MDENLVMTMNENMVFDYEWEYVGLLITDENMVLTMNDNMLDSGLWMIIWCRQWMRICGTVDYGWEYGVDNEWEYVGL